MGCRVATVVILVFLFIILGLFISAVAVGSHDSYTDTNNNISLGFMVVCMLIVAGLCIWGIMAMWPGASQHIKYNGENPPFSTSNVVYALLLLIVASLSTSAVAVLPSKSHKSVPIIAMSFTWISVVALIVMRILCYLKK